MINKIFNFQFSIFNLKKSERGFTLVELLASIIVLVAVGSIISGIISSTLRGTNKASNIENIRQNGNYVLNQMSKDISFSQPFDGSATGFNVITDTNGNKTYSTSCSSSTRDITVQSAVDATTTTEYVCSGSTLTANELPLIDDSISLRSCTFTCDQTGTGVPRIGIDFILDPGKSGLAESGNSIEFKTSVTLRNYNK